MYLETGWKDKVEPIGGLLVLGPSSFFCASNEPGRACKFVVVGTCSDCWLIDFSDVAISKLFVFRGFSTLAERAAAPEA